MTDRNKNNQENSMKNATGNQALSIIWDVTRYCPWNCAICCMSATSDRNRCNNELSLDQKLNVVEQISDLNKYRDVRVDLSGGEVFNNDGLEDHKTLIKALCKKIGREKIGISTSGVNVTSEMAEFLNDNVSDVEMTMDVLPGKPYEFRPAGYSCTAAEKIPILKNSSLKVGIQTVLSQANKNEENLRAIYKLLCEHHVDEWSLLRFFPVGRGEEFGNMYMNNAECREVVHMVNNIVGENKNPNRPKLHFHYTMPGHDGHTLECRCVSKSIGILPDGNVTSCFWAMDRECNIPEKYDNFALGNVCSQTLTDIHCGKKAQAWMSCKHYCELNAA